MGAAAPKPLPAPAGGLNNGCSGAYGYSRRRAPRIASRFLRIKNKQGSQHAPHANKAPGSRLPAKAPGSRQPAALPSTATAVSGNSKRDCVLIHEKKIV